MTGFRAANAVPNRAGSASNPAAGWAPPVAAVLKLNTDATVSSTPAKCSFGRAVSVLDAEARALLGGLKLSCRDRL